jgi:hypothetical protein
MFARINRQVSGAVVGGLAVGLLAGVAVATQVLFQGQLKSRIQIENSGGKEVTTLESSRFVPYGYAFPTPYLFAVTERTQTSTAVDGYFIQEVEIQAKKSVAGTFDQSLWAGKFQGSEFQTWTDDFVRVIEFGCCGARDVARLINIESGKRIEAANLDTLFAIEIPNRPEFGRRYIATVLDSKAPQNLGDKSYVGTISYFDSKRILSRVRVYARLDRGVGSEIWDVKPVHLTQPDKLTVQGKDIIQLWSGDQATSATDAFSGFAVETELNTLDGQTVEPLRIVVRGDQIDIGASTRGANTELTAN